MVSVVHSFLLTVKLLEDPLYYLQDVVAPGKMLFGRGTIFVNLNDMVFCVLKAHFCYNGWSRSIDSHLCYNEWSRSIN
ncbi:hypothetical protein QN277_000544 [Acacia crassicarpa]|uniref:Uncharacterized protein n=1 Tax=Acacia crassicarpa TaxID=499986 RepID=A0AAE1TG49_9FABA|nr:hypothetical protein QN277_000544 [Acacia crassicarpa]